VHAAPDLPDPARLRIAVADDSGLFSETIIIDFAAPRRLAAGAACTVPEARDVCPRGQGCQPAPGTEEGTCVAANAPVIGSVTARMANDQLALHVTGTDPEANPRGVRLSFLDGRGQPVPFGDAPTAEFEPPIGQWNVAGDAFDMVALLPLQNLIDCNATGDAAFRVCADAGEPQEECDAAFQEAGQACFDAAVVALAGAQTLEVEVYDATLRISAPVSDRVEPPGPLAQDDRCAPDQALGTCPPGMFCVGAPSICDQAPIGCGDAPVTDLTGVRPGANGRRVVPGDYGDAPPQGPGGTCGGGGPVDIYEFAAAVGGVYSFEITEHGLDSLMYLRSQCLVPDSELVCNDDIAQDNLLSRVEAELFAGQVVYLFVDSYNGESIAPYTLEVSSP